MVPCIMHVWGKKRVCVASCETTVWIQKGEFIQMQKSYAQDLLGYNSFKPLSLIQIHILLVMHLPLRFQTACFIRWPNLPLFFLWSDFNLNSMNQTRAFFLPFFSTWNIWTHLANQHMVHP